MAGLGCCVVKPRVHLPWAWRLCLQAPRSWSKGEGAKAQTAASSGRLRARDRVSWPLGCPWGRVQSGDGDAELLVSLSLGRRRPTPASSPGHPPCLWWPCPSPGSSPSSPSCWLACAVRRRHRVPGEGWGREAGPGGFPGRPSGVHSALACLPGLPGDHGGQGLGPHKPLFWGS